MANAAAIGRALRKSLSQAMSHTMLIARQSVTNATPVATEHAASNWVLSIGAPFDGVDGSRDAVSYSAQQEGDARVREYDIGRDGPRLFLRNNVFYLQFLDDGHSQQAPPGFVGMAISSAEFSAPESRKPAVATMLRNIATGAYHRGY